MKKEYVTPTNKQEEYQMLGAILNPSDYEEHPGEVPGEHL